MSTRSIAGRSGARTGAAPRFALLRALIVRDITGRYRGSVLGVLWSLVTPICMLAIYSVVFGSVLSTAWSRGNEQAHFVGFAIILFAGLIVFQLFSEVVTRAPTLVLANVTYVKKVVFPLEILPVVAIGSALFQFAVSLAAFIAFRVCVTGHLAPTALLVPVVLAPLVLLILGLAWFLASLGVYVRDTSQVLGTALTGLMFVSPIFFPATVLPEWIRPWLFLNPVTLPVEQMREVLIWGRLPDFAALGVYALCAALVATLGYAWFQATRKGFADAL